MPSLNKGPVYSAQHHLENLNDPGRKLIYTLLSHNVFPVCWIQNHRHQKCYIVRHNQISWVGVYCAASQFSIHRNHFSSRLSNSPVWIKVPIYGCTYCLQWQLVSISCHLIISASIFLMTSHFAILKTIQDHFHQDILQYIHPKYPYLWPSKAKAPSASLSSEALWVRFISSIFRTTSMLKLGSLFSFFSRLPKQPHTTRAFGMFFLCYNRCHQSLTSSEDPALSFKNDHKHQYWSERKGAKIKKTRTLYTWRNWTLHMSIFSTRSIYNWHRNTDGILQDPALLNNGYTFLLGSRM